MKIGWFSNAGKTTLKVILWLIVWIFFIIGVGITWISCLQWGDENKAPNVYEMVENFKFDHWLWIYNDNNDDSFGRYISLEPNWEDKVISIDELIPNLMFPSFSNSISIVNFPLLAVLPIWVTYPV